LLRAFAETLSLRSSGKPSRNATEKAAVHSTFWGGAGERARKVAQAHECERFFEAIRSLVHRVEGGMSNAIYWDRRAGTDVARPYPYAKWALLAEEVVRG